MRKGTFGRYECIYNNGSSHDVERWLRTSHKLDGVMKPLWEFEGTFNEANEVADVPEAVLIRNYTSYLYFSKSPTKFAHAFLIITMFKYPLEFLI